MPVTMRQFYWILIGFYFYFAPLFGLLMMIIDIYQHFSNINEFDIVSEEEDKIITDADIYPDRPIMPNIRRVSVSPYRKRQRI